MAKSNLKEFFVHVLREGPGDPTFHAAPEVKPIPGEEGQVDPSVGLPAPTQDVAPTSGEDLSFFSKNVGSTVGKLQLDGFDSGALQQFASALDQYVYEQYGRVQDPGERQSFEAEYQKCAADFSGDMFKLLEKVKAFASYGG